MPLMWKAFLQVDKGGFAFYELAVTEQQITDGFAVGAHSAQGSRFKLLLFERGSDGQCELLTQVTCTACLSKPITCHA